MVRLGETAAGLLTLLVGAGALCGGCNWGKDCTTGHAYQGTPVTEGTVTYWDHYGGSPVTVSLVASEPDLSGLACMQAPATCSSLAFFAYGDPYTLQGALDLLVRLSSFQNAQPVALPSSDVVVMASLEGLFPNDGGVGPETLTLTSGTVTVTLSPDNFDARFDMTFIGSSGDTVVVQNGRAESLNGRTYAFQNCD